MNKLISVVICTYNGELFLTEVIESVLKQKELNEIVDQVLIVDNASTDSTKEIVLKYAESNPLIKYIFEPTPGLSHARKHAANLKSQWVAFLDDDNVIFQEWLLSAKKFIDANPKAGVFNGASIPVLRDQVNEKELLNLKAIYPNLACTHYCLDDYNKGLEPKLKAPFGAGMILRKKELSNFLEKGWTHNEGRKGEQLGSGEDGEIASAILKQGYMYLFNYDMALWHIIPKGRLQDNYIKKLYEGLDEGYYKYISRSDSFVVSRVKICIRAFMGIVVFPFRSILENDQSGKILLKHSLISKMRFIKYTISDLLFIRKER
jgi:glycosyltransferase involved in cell wall biosynthesis